MKREHVISSLIYKLLERCGVQGVSFIINIILARLLAPSDYGVLTLITIFITLANVFVQSGLNTALIQRKNADNLDFSSVFFLSLAIAGALYTLLFFSAPFIAVFYNAPQVTSILRVISLTLFFGAFNSIQNAKISREMQFKKLMYSSLGSIIISGIVGIIMAYKGLGTWALVGMQLTSSLSICIIMWFTVKWRPQTIFSISRVKTLFGYGWKLLIANLVESLYTELRNLVIGKKFDSSMLGYYNRGQQFPSLIMTNVNGSIQSVMLPALSAEQDNKNRIKEMMRRSIVSCSFVIFPFMMGLAVVAKPLISLLLTDKWLPCVPFLQVYCFIFAFYPIYTANLQAINSIGRSDVILKLELIKKPIGLIALAISVFYFNSAYAIAIGMALTTPINIFINAFPNKKFFNYSLKEQLMDIMPSFSLSFFMGVVAWSVLLLNFNAWVTLIVQIVVGAVVYVSLAWIFKLECFRYLLGIVKGLFNSNENKKLN